MCIIAPEDKDSSQKTLTSYFITELTTYQLLGKSSHKNEFFCY